MPKTMSCEIDIDSFLKKNMLSVKELAEKTDISRDSIYQMRVRKRTTFNMLHKIEKHYSDIKEYCS